MQGIDWIALPTVAEYLNIEDQELLLTGLFGIRDYYSETDRMRRLMDGNNQSQS
jgi:hypothetical protein